jgi:hypothetical protein
MSKTENKTQQTDDSVADFIAAVPDAQKREDSQTLVKLMSEITGEEAKLWGPSIIGFGSVHYKYESGREGDMGVTGFSPRKNALTIYLVDGFDKYTSLLGKLGRFKTSKVCLYVKKLADINMDVLKELITKSVDATRKMYP